MKNFGKGYWKTFEQGIQREWVITNGIGGYAGDSIIGAHTRKHHGLLIASLHPPVERFLLLSKVEETIAAGDRSFMLAANQRPGNKKEEGQKYLQRFLWDAVPTYVYHAEDIHVNKTIAMVHGKNTTVIGYEVRNGARPSVLTLKPCFNYREAGDGSKAEDLIFEQEISRKKEGPQLVLKPEKNPKVKLHFYCSQGMVKESKAPYEETLELQTEIDTGMSCSDVNYHPVEIEISLEPFAVKQISVIASLEEEYPEDAFDVIKAAKERGSKLVEQALKGRRRPAGELYQDLVQAADCFIVDRHSTGYKTILAGLPWFTDWGRDTMIAMQGLTLVTGRLGDAREILLTFAKYIQDGLVPNMFPDEGLEPLYNTVDASLWYFHSVDQYLKYADDQREYDFVKEDIYPKLKEIIEAYQKGTSFSIYMDKDSLIHAGGEFDQVTWMDVRVGEWVVTPRHGKCVEINALWYNALKVMEELAKRYGDFKEAWEYALLAGQVKDSFCLKFWNEAKNCLFDVVDEEPLGWDGSPGKVTNNDQIRPNQIYAVSLPNTMLEKEKEKAVVNTVFSHLYATYGLRSLSPEDKEYKGAYFGALSDRDAAYHQGTVWAFPLGAFITAYVKIMEHSRESISYARELLESVSDHLRDGCIGQIAEIFDGDEPHISRGCYGQAWSVGEILRAYAEDVLNFK